MEKVIGYLPDELVTFLLVTLFSLLIGLSQRRISLKREGETTLFGTDRTFTFIGILGYLLYILDPDGYKLFMGGGAILGLLLALNYYVKQMKYHVFGVTTIVIALITYCLAPIVATQPSWFYIMVVVTVLLFTELKHTFTELAQRMKNDEMITLAKFLAISGIILPMLPQQNMIPGINLTPHAVWLATVVVSGVNQMTTVSADYLTLEADSTKADNVVAAIGAQNDVATVNVAGNASVSIGNKGAGVGAASVVVAVFVVNLRHLLMSAALAEYLAPLKRWQRFLFGCELTDETFGVHIGAFQKGWQLAAATLYSCNITAHAAWVGGTVLGVFCGELVTDVRPLGLDYALTAMFLALLVPQCVSRLHVAVALLAGVLSLGFKIAGMGQWNVVMATVLAACAGTCLLARQNRRPQGERA